MSIQGIAYRDGIDASDVGRSIQLAFLAPDIVETILAGRQPVELTAKRLKRIGALPLEWDRQRRLVPPENPVGRRNCGVSDRD